MKKTITHLIAATLALSFGVFTTQAQTAYPYFQNAEVAADITTVATAVENPATALVDITGNFTIQATGTAGVEIKISNGTIYYSYTPAVSGDVRFVKKNGVVYVYEGSTYKGKIYSLNAIAYPITDATATTSPLQMLQNASFETPGTLAGGTNYNFGTPWVTNVTVGTSGGIRITDATTGNVNGTWECVWRGTANGNYFAQPINGIKPNTTYRVVVRQIASGNANADFNVGLGSTVSGMEYGMGTIKLGTTYDGTRAVTFTTSETIAETSYFTFKNTSTNTSSSGTDPLTQMDYIALMEGPSLLGISGTTGNVYHSTSVLAPLTNPNFQAGDYYDMSPLVANPSFEVSGLTGWTNNGMQTQTNAPGQGWTKDGSVYCEKWVAQTGNLPVAGISQTVTGLPNGVYKLKAAGHAIKQGATDPNATTGAFLYAGTIQTPVNAGKEYEVANVVVTNNTLAIGFKLEGTITCNWAAVDNFRLSYHGVDLTALNNVLNEKKAAAQAILDATNTPKGFNKTELQTAIAEAGTVAQTEEAINAAIAKLTTAITNYNNIVTAYAVLKEAFDFAATLSGSNYPGKTAFDEAVATAQGVYDNTDDKTAQNFTDAAAALKASLQTYVLSQSLPANVTPMLANPGFDVEPVTFTQTDGTANGSVVSGTPGYNIPGWDEAYAGGYPRVATTNYGITFTTIPDVLNGTTPPATDKAGLTNGAALVMSGSWGSTTVLTQNLTLPLGTYALSYEVMNKNAGQSIENNRFGFVPNQGDAVYGTKTLFADTWTTETVNFYLSAETAGKISIGLIGKSAGAGSNGKLYIDNIKLVYYGDAAIVTFNTNGGSELATQYVTKGEKLAVPVAPNKEGYVFDGWYSDTELTTAWDFNTALATNVTLYAKWNLPKSTVATLNDLKVGDVTVENFSASTYTYNVVLPVGTASVPVVTATTTDAKATAAVTAAAQLPGATTVVVTAEDGTTQLTYTVNFTVAKSTVATLSDLKVDGTTVANFDAATMTYDVVLANGTTVVPTVTAVTTNDKANAAVTAAAQLPGATTVEVTAEDGTTKLTYTVNFTVAKSTVATLSDLKVDGTTVANFDAATMTYDVVLASGTTVVPTVTAVTTNDKANAVVTAAAQLPGATTVVVTAEDGTTKLNYTVNFTVATGVKPVAGLSINVYPTVSKTTFNVDTNGKASTITVMNITGKVVASYTGTAVQSISVPQAGIYLIKVECEGTTKLVKVIKNN